mmetsp:Transcript_107894/g.168586  ORF Transcript_107894/g.168586 Transcript_107894/m.168586 type:complete len:604 (-) Transcript_107894:8-1819(-)
MKILIGSVCRQLCIGIVIQYIVDVASGAMLRQSHRLDINGTAVEMPMSSEDIKGIDPSHLAVLDVTTEAPAFVVEVALDWHPKLPNVKDLFSYWLFIVISLALWITIVALTAFAYKNSQGYLPEVAVPVDESAKLHKVTSQWQVKWYQCCTQPSICFWSCCCPYIRWAHTMDLMDFIDYGPAFVMFLMLQCMNCLSGFIFIGVCFTMVLVYYRQRLRKAFGISKYGTCCGYFEDCMCLCFCTACIFAQEAVHVQRAAELGIVLPALTARKKETYAIHGQIDNSALTRLPRKSVSSPGESSSLPSFQDVNSKSSGSNGSLNNPVADPDDNNGVVLCREASPVVATPKEVVVGGCRRQYGRTSWLVQNPTPERLLAPPPVRLGAHGEVRGTISFVQLLGMLHDDLRAYVFLFGEVGCVGHCAAACRLLHVHIWTDRAFWHFYVGSGVNDRLAQPSACPAGHLREAFRRWIFHIDGAWTKDLREFAERSRHSRSDIDQVVMLSYARYIASGLMPYDSRSSVAEFAGIVGDLLAEYNPQEVDARQEAEALTAQIECMGEVFTEAQIKYVVSAFDCSLGRLSSSEEEEPEANVIFPNVEIQVVDAIEE